ncbi:MAG: GIY-YIG nuclease family protein [Chitinophagales bacterium]|nr:GIY-YIG nuclease family protein [Chitinophagales bacterium]
MFYVYILFSEGFDRFYIGQTNDIENRIARHNSGMEKSTSPYVPWSIVCVIEKGSRSESMILERKLKNLNRLKLIRFIEKYT